MTAGLDHIGDDEICDKFDNGVAVGADAAAEAGDDGDDGDAGEGDDGD